MSEIIKGKVVNVFPPKTSKTGKAYTNFSLKLSSSGEDVKCVTFNPFPNDCIWKEVEFEATYNDKYSQYVVKGGISIVEIDKTPVSSAPPSEPAPAPAKKRGRPAKAVTGAPVATPPADDLYAKALATVEKNLSHARAMLPESASTEAQVAVADMIGRTYVALAIERAKSGRFDQMQRNK